jgi:hypothetical protein
LLASKDQTLLVGRDASCLVSDECLARLGNSPFFVLDFCLDIVDCVRGLDLKSDGFAREAGMMYRSQRCLRKVARDNPRLNENLHVDPDAPVCPTNLTMESLTKARAVVEESKSYKMKSHPSMVRALRFILT